MGDQNHTIVIPDLKIAQLKDERPKSLNCGTWGTKIAQFRTKGSKLYDHNTWGTKSTIKSIVKETMLCLESIKNEINLIWFLNLFIRIKTIFLSLYHIYLILKIKINHVVRTTLEINRIRLKKFLRSALSS